MSQATNGNGKRRTTELCPSPHLEAADLEIDTVVTIKAYDWHPVGEDKEIRGVIYFKEFERGLVMNRTNTKMLAQLHGNDLDAIIGKQIVIGPDTTDFGKQGMVPCIRIRSKLPVAATTKTATPAHVPA